MSMRNEDEGSTKEELQRQLATAEDALDNVQRRRTAENRAAFEEVRRLEHVQRRLEGLLTVTNAELQATLNTKTFRYTTKLRHLYGRLRRRPTAGEPLPAGPIFPPDGTYETWIELFDTIDDGLRHRIDARVRSLVQRPKISVIMPVYDPPLDMLRAAIDSVRNQIYPDWELCIADDCSSDPRVVPLLREYAAADQRIKVLAREENGHISAASNTALSMATGEWVTSLDHDDLLVEHALAIVAFTLSTHPETCMAYADEDHLDEKGRRYDPFFKPDFDPLLLLGQNCLLHLTVSRKDLVDRVGGYRVGYEGSQDWDLALRVTEMVRPEQVVHIPHVLYHWRAHKASTASGISAKPYAVGAGQQAVIDHLKRKGQSARVSVINIFGHNRVSWDLPVPSPRVTIIVPTRDGHGLQRCLDSIYIRTTYPNFEVVVVDLSSRTFSTLHRLQGYDDRVTIIRDENPFNIAAMSNRAVERTFGEVICLLKDDTEVISGDWLNEMVGQLLQPGIGAVGAKLYYGDFRIQHAGFILGIGGIAGSSHRNADRLSVGYAGHLLLAHRMSAVTAACMVVRRNAWREVHGMDEENVPDVFNDVDFCLRLREQGWDTVWTPYAELFNHESATSGPNNGRLSANASLRETDYMEARWSLDGLLRDPYYNPNLSLDAEDFSLAWPPRASYDQ